MSRVIGSFTHPERGREKAGEQTLGEWVGWKRGRDYHVQEGALVRIEKTARGRL